MYDRSHFTQPVIRMSYILCVHVYGAVGHSVHPPPPLPHAMLAEYDTTEDAQLNSAHILFFRRLNVEPSSTGCAFVDKTVTTLLSSPAVKKSASF